MVVVCAGELNPALPLLKSGWLAYDYIISILIRGVTGLAAVVASCMVMSLTLLTESKVMWTTGEHHDS